MKILVLEVLLAVLCVTTVANAFANESLNNGKSTGKRMKFNNIYEPSAVIQLADGRLLVIEDEQANPFSLHQISESGGQPSLGIPVSCNFTGVADDLEGLAADHDGWIYAITSHSLAGDGTVNQGRTKLLRFKVSEDGGIEHYQEYGGLFAALLQTLKTVDPAAVTMNIEGLSFDRDGRKLLIGLRQPVVSKASLVLSLENPEGIFSQNEPPRIASEVIGLDLLGGGIRAMAYAEQLNGYLIANEIMQGQEGKFRASLWLWDGIGGHEAHRLEFPGIGKLKNIEGISPIMVQNKAMLLLVCDDGKRQKSDGAHYRFVEYGELHDMGAGE